MLDSRTSPLLRIFTLLPILAFLSTIALRTWVLAPAATTTILSLSNKRYSNAFANRDDPVGQEAVVVKPADHLHHVLLLITKAVMANK